MYRLKLAGMLTGVVALLALTTSPASAISVFESKTGQAGGKGIVLKSGQFKYNSETNVKCPNTTEIKAIYLIQGWGQIKQQQKVTTVGPHLQIQVKAWGKCTAEAGVFSEEAKVGECNFQLAIGQDGVIRAGLDSVCVITTGLCTIQVPAGMEKGTTGSGRGINVGLEEIKATNSGNNLLGLATITKGGEGQLGTVHGILAYASGGFCPISSPNNEEGSLTGFEIEGEGVNTK